MDQGPSPGSPEGERLDVLSALIEAHEQKHHAIDAPDKGGIGVKNLKDLKAELLANPAVRQAYDAQAPVFELVRERIAARMKAGLTQGDVAARMGTSAIHAYSPTLCQRRGSACLGAHGAFDGYTTSGCNAG